MMDDFAKLTMVLAWKHEIMAEAMVNDEGQGEGYPRYCWRECQRLSRAIDDQINARLTLIDKKVIDETVRQFDQTLSEK